MKHPGKNSAVLAKRRPPSRAVKGEGGLAGSTVRPLPPKNSPIPPTAIHGLGGLLGGSLDDFLDRLLDNLGLGRSDLVVRAADEQLHRRLDVAVQRDGHLVLAGRLDGVAQLDAATIDVDVRRGLDGIGDHLSGNGTEQMTLFAHLGFDLDERAVELLP